MEAYRVTVKQHTRSEAGDWEDATFTQYVESMRLAAEIVLRFKNIAVEDKGYRVVESIKIKTITIQMEETKSEA